MDGDRTQNPTQLAVISSLPLLWAVRSLEEAVFLSAAVVTSILIFEAFLWATRRFWFKSILPAVALVIIASVISAISLVSKHVLTLSDRTAAMTPLSLPAAFLFASRAISHRKSWGRRTLLSWSAFFVLLFTAGALRQWAAALQMFSPASIWIAALAVAGSFWWEKGRAS